MGDKCGCKPSENDGESFYEYLKMFNVIASSNIIRGQNTSGIEYTTILKCNECNSYYIWDRNNENEDSDEKINVRKYSPKTNDDGLRKALGDVNGVVKEKDIDWHSELVEKLKEIEFNNIRDDITKN